MTVWEIPKKNKNEVAKRVGYCVKYVMKEAQDPDLRAYGVQRGRRNNILSSRGLGYFAKRHIETRKNYIKTQDRYRISEEETVTSVKDTCDVMYTPAFENKGCPSLDAITEEDKAFFENLDLSRRTNRYRYRKPDGSWEEVIYKKNGGVEIFYAGTDFEKINIPKFHQITGIS